MALVSLIFIGPPGSGKGTQANLLKKDNYKHISTGDLLRAEVKSGSGLGLEIKEVIDQGKLVSDEIVTRLLEKNLDFSRFKYIFDGYPRNRNQAKVLNSLLPSGGFKVMYFDADLEGIKERIVSRRVAPHSGEIYNLMTKPPKVDGICDVSGEVLIHRKDDQMEVVNNRFEVYVASRDELLGFYAKEDVIRLDASLSVNEVREEITRNLQ
ncbi:MAG: adenylate kinase [Halobacteriovoraceae bacterium]|nr:adenylate kinase [Halobacteriovoraceae bacterium]